MYVRMYVRTFKKTYLPEYRLGQGSVPSHDVASGGCKKQFENDCFEIRQLWAQTLKSFFHMIDSF